MKVKISPALLAGFLVLPAAVAGEDFTLEHLADRALISSLAVPRFLWLPDEKLLLVDPRRPEAERTLELLDPATLERRPAADSERVLSAWKESGGDAPERLGLPGAAAGPNALLYERGGDLFLADLEAARGQDARRVVRRLTNTEAPESSPRFSPGGKFLAYVRDHDLFVVETATGRERRLTHDGSATLLNGTLSWVYWEEIWSRRDEAYWWSPDGSRILFLQTDDAAVPRFPLPAHEPATPQVRWQRYPKAGAVNPEVRLGVVAVEGDPGDASRDPGGEGGGGVRWLDLGTPRPEYIARAGWLPDGSAVAVQTLNRAQDRLELSVIDLKSGNRRLALADTAATWINLHDDAHFLAGDHRFLWLSEREGFRRLYLHDLKGGPALPLTDGSSPVRPANAPEPWIGAVAWLDGKAGRLLFHAALPTSIETQLYAVNLDGGSLRRLSEGDGTHRAAVSPRGGYYVDEHSRAGVPPRLTLHRIDGTLLHVIAPAATEVLARFAFEPPDHFEVQADDGVSLSARLIKPRPLVEGRKYPAIVNVYGGPGSPLIGDDWDGVWYLWAQVLAQRGFAVFSIDPRSAADRGKALEDSVHRRFYGPRELADILAGVKHLKSLPFVDPGRVGIWGWSGGGSTTLYAMTHAREFRAGIAVAGITDYRYYDTVYTERFMGKPEANEEGYRASSPVTAAADLHGRLLLVHGMDDDNVHFQNAVRFADALIAAGIQFDFMAYPDRDHGIADPAARRHLFRLMLDFWERELKG
jgi:dipeptidyl-peptidase-4